MNERSPEVRRVELIALLNTGIRAVEDVLSGEINCLSNTYRQRIARIIENMRRALVNKWIPKRNRFLLNSKVRSNLCREARVALRKLGEFEKHEFVDPIICEIRRQIQRIGDIFMTMFQKNMNLSEIVALREIIVQTLKGKISCIRNNITQSSFSDIDKGAAMNFLDHLENGFITLLVQSEIDGVVMISPSLINDLDNLFLRVQDSFSDINMPREAEVLADIHRKIMESFSLSGEIEGEC